MQTPNAHSHRQIRMFGPVYALAVAPDGIWLASGGACGTVRIWDAAAGAQRAVLASHRSSSVYAPDGVWVAGGASTGQRKSGIRPATNRKR
jgi:WD40 repeat protein